MSSSNFKLTVEAGDPLALVEIAGSDYSILTSGDGKIEFSVKPGLYIARAKAGRRMDERIIRVRDKDEHVRLSERSNDEPAVDRLSWPGKGWSGFAPPPGPGITVAVQEGRHRFPPTVAFVVCTLDGGKVGALTNSFSEGAEPSGERGVWTSSSLGLAPGVYGLSMPVRGRLRGMIPLHVSERCSPTLVIEALADDNGEACVDFDRLIVSYAPDALLDEDSLSLRAMAVARRSLELQRFRLVPALTRIFLEKPADPMLGLLLLQLMLLPASAAGRTKAELGRQFDEIAMKVSDQLGMPMHPDLVLLRAQARRKKWHVEWQPEEEEPLQAPPLLMTNWKFLNSLPARRYELADPVMLLYEIGRSLLQTGVWVGWKAPAEKFRNFDAMSAGLVAEHLLADTRKSAPRAEIEFVRYTDDYAAPRPPRTRAPTADVLLESAVDLLRANPALKSDLMEKLSEQNLPQSMLDQTVISTALQLAEIDRKVEQSVPKGYSSRLARNLSVPLAVVRQSIAEVERSLRQDRHTGGLGALAAGPLDPDEDVL